MYIFLCFYCILNSFSFFFYPLLIFKYLIYFKYIFKVVVFFFMSFYQDVGDVAKWRKGTEI